MVLKDDKTDKTEQNWWVVADLNLLLVFKSVIYILQRC